MGEEREWKPITHPFLALVSPAKQHIEMETDGMETVASCQGERDIWEQVEVFAENLWAANAQFGWCVVAECLNSLWQHKLTFSGHGGGGGWCSISASLCCPN